MARTAVNYSTFGVNSTNADPSGTAVTSGAGNGGRIASAVPEQTILRIANSSGGAGTATILAGTYPPALAAGQGNLTTASIANGAAAFVGPLESGRFLQNDGSLLIESSVAVTITAIKVARS